MGSYVLGKSLRLPGARDGHGMTAVLGLNSATLMFLSVLILANFFWQSKR